MKVLLVARPVVQEVSGPWYRAAAVRRCVQPVLCAAALLASLLPAQSIAQTTTKRTPDEMRALHDAHKGDFDYLLGDWAFDAESREYGKFRGYWSAVRLDQGQILDEYRVVGDNDEALYTTTSLRNYNAALDRWELVGLDGSNGLQDIGTGRRVGSEMHIEQRFGVTSGKPSLWRIRYYDIGADRFSWTADRSMDDGKTWVEKHQTIAARRIGPARSMGPLVTGKAAAPTTAPAAGDPLSGDWGSDGVTYLELKFDGKSAVTGTVIWRIGEHQERAPIRTGSFDTATGALKLEGEAKRPDNGVTASYAIEGKVDKQTVSGTFKFDDRTGSFTFTRK